MISFRSLTGLILMMEIIVKISAIQQLTFSRFRDLLTVQFRLDKPIPYALIRKIVKFRVKENSVEAAKWKKK